MAITPSTLSRYFERYGWEYRTTDNPDIVLTGYIDGDSRRTIAVAISEMFVTFTCPLQDFQYTEALAERLLRLNFDLPVAKVSLDEDRSVVVSVEMPADGFGFDAFSVALDILLQAVEVVRSPDASTPAPGAEADP